MPRDTSGTYTKPAGTTAITGTPISSSSYNNLANDQASALTDSLSRSGKGGMQADLSMGGKKITSLAAGTDAADALRKDQIDAAIAQTFRGSSSYGGVSGGSANAQTISVSPAPTAYALGLMYWFIAGFTNTGSVSLNINGLGAKTLRKNGDLANPVDAGDIAAGRAYIVIDRGASGFEVINPWGSIGNAASRNVGTANNQLVEVADGSGNLSAALNVANKALANLASSGIARTIWASIAFTGAGGVVAAFNSAGVTRNGVGLYTVSFPDNGGDPVSVDIVIDRAITSNAVCAHVVSGTRTTTSVQIVTTQGNSSLSPFDPDRVTVSVSRIT